jgi:hypothetical protein
MKKQARLRMPNSFYVEKPDLFGVSLRIYTVVEDI